MTVTINPALAIIDMDASIKDINAVHSRYSVLDRNKEGFNTIAQAMSHEDGVKLLANALRRRATAYKTSIAKLGYAHLIDAARDVIAALDHIEAMNNFEASNDDAPVTPKVARKGAHANCDHDATKVARAKCRRDAAKAANVEAKLDELSVKRAASLTARTRS